jgi:hypothetical protein
VASELNEIFARLNAFFGKQVVVSEGEIRAAVSGEVDRLDPPIRKKLEDELHGDLKEVLTGSITGYPISVYSPNLTSKRNYLGETFYHYPTHAFLADELEDAYKRMAKLRSTDTTDTLQRIATAFLQKAGYDVRSDNAAGT